MDDAKTTCQGRLGPEYLFKTQWTENCLLTLRIQGLSKDSVCHQFNLLSRNSRKIRHGSLVIYSKKQEGGLSSEDFAVTS